MNIEDIKPGMSLEDQRQAVADIRKALGEAPPAKADAATFDIDEIKPGMDQESTSKCVGAILKALKDS